MLRHTICLLVTIVACSRSTPQVSPTAISQLGGDLVVRGELAGQGGVVVLVDGVAAQSVVRESEDLIRMRVPALPRTGHVDVELLFGDGASTKLDGALTVSPPQVDVRPASSAGLDAE